jgi:hypothetical protein
MNSCFLPFFPFRTIIKEAIFPSTFQLPAAASAFLFMLFELLYSPVHDTATSATTPRLSQLMNTVKVPVAGSGTLEEIATQIAGSGVFVGCGVLPAHGLAIVGEEEDALTGV